MIQLTWQDQPLAVRRIVLRRDDRTSYETRLGELAEQLGLSIADDDSAPQSGDFWAGCHPSAGWADADPLRVGWASLVDLPLVVGLLHLTVVHATPAAPLIEDEPVLSWAA